MTVRLHLHRLELEEDASTERGRVLTVPALISIRAYGRLLKDTGGLATVATPVDVKLTEAEASTLQQLLKAIEERALREFTTVFKQFFVKEGMTDDSNIPGD